MNAYLSLETNRLRHQEMLREAANRAPRSGRRQPRRPRVGRHRAP